MFSDRVTSTSLPPLVELGELATETPGTISLGQGVPFYVPPWYIWEEFYGLLRYPEIHRYAPDQGRPSFRKELSMKLKSENTIPAEPEEIIVTPGANLAYYIAVSTLADPGDKIGLISPYYFNHEMACTLLNVKPVEIPLTDNLELRAELIEEVVADPRTKAITLVNPSNPTGKVFEISEIKMIRDLVEDYEKWLICDETYEYFVYEGDPHISGGSILGLVERTITIGSLSKSYGIPGWRVGYLHAPGDFAKEAIKVQDTTAITAPTPSQVLGELLLKERKTLIEEFFEYMKQNYEIAKKRLEDVPWLIPTPARGAYYLFPKIAKDISYSNGFEFAKKLILEAGVYAVPGEAFGRAGRGHLRLSFGNTRPKELNEAFDRLASYSPT